MVTEGEVFIHVYNVHRIVFVLFLEMLKNANFFLSLAMESLFVSHHLQRYMCMKLVIVGFDDLTKTALAYNFENFISICDVIMWRVEVGPVLIIIAIVVGTTENSLPFLGILADKIYLRVVEYLMVFK